MNFKEQLKKIMSFKFKHNYIMLLGFIGIFLIAFSTLTFKKKDENKQEEIKNCFNHNNTDEYAKQLENKLNNIISKIKGVGKSEVFITIENGIENIYANSEKKTTNSNENLSGKMSKKDDSQKDVVVIDSNEGKKALIVTQKEPKIKGVLVVCEGADNIKVVEDVTQAISKCLNIKKNRLSVVKSA